MRGWIAPGLLFLAALSGCGGSSAAPALSPAPEVHAGAPSRDAVARVAQSFQAAYGRADWTEIRREFVTESAAEAVLKRMKRWKLEGVTDLRVRLIHAAPLHGGTAATLEFSSDPRAIPDYAILLFRSGPQGPRSIREVTGLTGSTYQVANWSVTHSAHVDFYHSKYQLAGTDRRWVAALEHERAAFIAKFHLKLPARARYYLYPQQSMMHGMTAGVCGSSPENLGCTNPYANPPVIHTSLWPTFHEPIHVFQLALDPPRHEAPLFISEGMAVALEDRDADPRTSDYCSDLRYVPLDDCAVEALGDAKPLEFLSDKGFNSHELGSSYLLGGSFVKYLMLHGGYPKFGKFYYKLAAQPTDHISDYEVATRAIYHRSIEQLVGSWKAAVCGNRC